MPHVSIIIPNYNCAPWLPATLDSCLSQKEHVKEIIIVDDYSSDDSWDILQHYQRSYPALIYIYRNDRKGGNHARNFGFSHATGNYIQWLDADDQLGAGKLTKQLLFFEENTACDIVYSDWQLNTCDSNWTLLKRELKTNKRSNDFLYDLLFDKWSPPHVYLLKRNIAEVLASQLAWNPQTAVGQDREYFTIAAIVGAKFEYVSGNFAVYNRWNKNSVSASGNTIRYRNLNKMLTRFKDLIMIQEWISSENRKKYFNVIETQILLLVALGFREESIEIKTSLLEFEWKLVHGIRTKLKVLLIFYKLMLKRML